MSDGTKRTLEELITLHELEPGLSEVITEGRFDSSFLRWFLRRMGSDASVYCVLDRLDVPAGELTRQGLSRGNRSRVIASSAKVEETSPVTASKVSFVYDMDDDVIAGRPLAASVCLFHTDYRSIEIYCFAENPIDKLLMVRLRAPEEIKARDIVGSISEPLIQLAFVRLVLSGLAPPVGAVESFEKKCSIDGDLITLDVAALFLDSINSARDRQSLHVTVDELVSEQHEARSEWTSDIRLAIRGHDFTRLCCYYLKTRYPGLFKDDRGPYKVPEVFEATLLTCLEADELLLEPLFMKLVARHCP